MIDNLMAEQEALKRTMTEETAAVQRDDMKEKSVCREFEGLKMAYDISQNCCAEREAELQRVTVTSQEVQERCQAAELEAQNLQQQLTLEVESQVPESEGRPEARGPPSDDGTREGCPPTTLNITSERSGGAEDSPNLELSTKLEVERENLESPPTNNQKRKTSRRRSPCRLTLKSRRRPLYPRRTCRGLSMSPSGEELPSPFAPSEPVPPDPSSQPDSCYFL